MSQDTESLLQDVERGAPAPVHDQPTMWTTMPPYTEALYRHHAAPCPHSAPFAWHCWHFAGNPQPHAISGCVALTLPLGKRRTGAICSMAFPLSAVASS